MQRTIPDESRQESIFLGLSQRMPPANIEAEQSLLGALLANNKAYDRVRHFLKPVHFADPIHQRIYSVIQERVERGQLADAVTLKNVFDGSHVLDEVGGVGYLAQLLTVMIGIINAGEYGLAIFDAWARRELIQAGENAINRAFSADVDAAGAAAAAMEEIGRLQAGPGVGRPLVPLGEAVDAALQEADDIAAGRKTLGLSTGMQPVDDVLGGLEPDALYVLAGRPGSGKSALGHQWALNVARSGVGVLEISLEMNAKALARRALAAAGGVPLWAMRMGKHGDYIDAILRARKELKDLPLLIEDGGNLTVAQIESVARAASRRIPLGLVMVDHLHIVTGDDPRKTETEKVRAISNGMKRLAKSLRVPVLALAQLNRGVESRDDKRPGKADLRQSGAIEEDADAIAFLHRPELYIPKSAPDRNDGESDERYAGRVASWHTLKAQMKGVAELIFDKVREGDTPTVKLQFDGPTTSFRVPGQGGGDLA